MPIGVIVNCCAVFFGGILGAFLGNKIPERLRLALPLTFGAASMGMGVIYTNKIHTLPAVVLALILGSAIGELIRLEEIIGKIAHKAKGPIERIFSKNKNDSNSNNQEFIEKFVGVLILFCASGTGIFGALKEGMTGDYSILIAKSILDFFTAAIFATALGYIVGFICIPQIVIMLALFFGATLILPLTTSELIADFTACGGIIMLATGFRISGIKSFPVANMLPALILVMPISHLWIKFIA